MKLTKTNAIINLNDLLLCETELPQNTRVILEEIINITIPFMPNHISTITIRPNFENIMSTQIKKHHPPHLVFTLDIGRRKKQALNYPQY